MDLEFVITSVVLIVVFESIKVARKVKQETAKQTQKRQGIHQQHNLDKDDLFEKHHVKNLDMEDEMENGFYEVSPDEYEDAEMHFEEEFNTSKNENLEGNSSKSGSYFTYEDENSSQERIQPEVVENDSEAHSDGVQSVENEGKKCDVNLQDPEELKKAVLYSEILKNPYN